MSIRAKNKTFKLDHKEYLSITDILESEPWARNLMVITGKGTGKSSSARKIMGEAVMYDGKEHYETKKREKELVELIFNKWIKSKQQIRTAWIRNTEKAMKTSVKNKFKAYFPKENGYRVDDTGVYKEKDELPIVLFVNLSCPDNYADNNLKCRIIVYDEFNNFDNDGQSGTKDVMKDFIHTYTDLIQGITRPYDDGEPYIIMLANPRTTPDENDLYDLFNCRWDWNKCNVKDQFIKNKKMKFLGIWTAPFKIKEMEYSLGNIKSVGNDYPKYNAKDKRVYWWQDAKRSFIDTAKNNPTKVFGITYKETDFECCYMQLGNREIIYIHELRNYIEAVKEDIMWFTWEWEDKIRDNQLMTKDGIWTSFKNYYKQSSIFFSSGYAKKLMKELACKVIKTLKD